jgi:hypothetical protein
MQMARSGLAVAAGFVVFSVLFTVIGPSLGAILTTAAAGLMAGYLTAKLAVRREMTHAGATAGLVAASLVVQPVLTLPVRIFVAGLAVLAISAGGWVRVHARIDAPGNADSRQAKPGPPHDSRSPEGHGGEERS